MARANGLESNMNVGRANELKSTVTFLLKGSKAKVTLLTRETDIRNRHIVKTLVHRENGK